MAFTQLGYLSNDCLAFSPPRSASANARWKRRREYPSQGPFHTTLENFENAALFLRLRLPSTLIRHERRAFRKRSSYWRNLKIPALRFSVDGKQSGAFHVTSLSEFSSNKKSKMAGDCCVFKFLRRSVDGKHLMGFQSENSVFKLLRRTVDGP